jgi:outer membrane immunogenic protein
MKNLLLTTTAIAALSGGAVSAADLPLKAARPAADMYVAPSWTGFYVGAHVGVGRLNAFANAESFGDAGFDSLPCSGNYNSSCASSKTGAVGGVEVGYDWQKGTFVYGVAADWTWTDLKTKTQRSSGGSAYTFNTKIDWLASFRGRMGLAVQDTMVYVTGGLALGGIKSHTFMAGPSDFFTYGKLSSARVGWVIGGGVEHRFARNWSFKAEALYYDLGKATSNITNQTDQPYSTTFHHEILIGRVGLNYRF